MKGISVSWKIQKSERRADEIEFDDNLEFDVFHVSIAASTA